MKFQNIHQVFEAQAAAFPDRIAVADDKGPLTYSALNFRANQLADLLIQCRLPAESIIGLLLDNSNESIVSVLAVLKAGCAFLPIDTQFPFERIKLLLSEARSPVLISTSHHIDALNRLQWECRQLDHVIVLDSHDFYGEKEEASAKMSVELWDYVGDTAEDDIARGGWVSGYDGRHFSRREMDEYAENIFIKLKPYLSETTRVLEIGCSSGITLFRIAPWVGAYTATDISSTIVEHTRREAQRKGFGNIRFATLGAHELHKLGEADFDIIIFNSVIQNFNGLNYLRRVLKDSIKLAKPQGVLFIGDILDLDLKDELIKSFSNYSVQSLRTNHKTKTDWSNELFVSRDFLADLQVEIPSVRGLSFSSKIASIENELTLFRYDAVLKIDKGANGVEEKPVKRKHQVDASDLDRRPGNNCDLPVESGTLAYLLFTSGSTGTPKGVMVTHHSILNYADWFVNEFRIDQRDSSMLLSKMNFDGVYTSVWGTLLTGGFLRIIPYGKVLAPDAILDRIAVDKITFLKLTPTLLNILINDRDASKLFLSDKLRLMVIGGESINTADVKKILDVRQDIELVNHYGPTEATIGVVFCRITPDQLDDFIKRPVIGSPISNTTIFVLDDQLELLPENIPGEIYIAGSSLARGYLNNPEYTRQKFIQDPFGHTGSGCLYRTGDIGRWLPGNVLELMGRVDDQIKIRGHRIEAGEIEKTLQECSGILHAKVLKRSDSEANDFLVAYYTSTAEPDTAELKYALEKRLPEHMVPAYFVKLDTFPLNNSGKINIKLLPDPLLQLRANDLAEASTDLERSIMGLWREILGREDFGVEDNFFDIGGHSLKAIRLCSLVYRKLSIEVKLRAIFENPTVALFARFIEGARKSSYKEIRPVKEAEYYDVSHGQMRLWLSSQREETSLAYLQVCTKILRGKLQIKMLGSAFRRLIDRHEILRTTFHFINGSLKQRVRTTEEIYTPFELIDLRIYEDAEFVKTEVINSQLRTNFDLENGPLFRVCVIQKNDEECIFILTIHHIITDGLSNELLISEIGFYYNNYVLGCNRELPPLRIQYKDFAQWQNEVIENEITHRHFWKKQLEGNPAFISFPADHGTTVKGNEGLVHTIVFDTELCDKIRKLTKKYDGTLFIFFLSSMFSLLYRYTSEKDLLLGTSVTGRDDLDLHSQIGFYINTLPLRLRLDGDETFMDVFKRVRHLVLDVFAHQVYPFDRILEENAAAGVSKESEMIGVMFNWQIKKAIDSSQASGKLEGVEIDDYPLADTLVKFDITLNFLEYEKDLVLNMEYRKDMFDARQIYRAGRHLINLVSSVSENESLAIAECDLSGMEEREQLTGEFNFTDAIVSEDRTVISLFEEQVLRSPDRIAIESEGSRTTFRELNALSNQLARFLIRETGVASNDLVGILLEHSDWMIVSILAVLKCGACYVPLDPTYPPERIGYMINDSKLKCVLADKDNGEGGNPVKYINIHSVKKMVGQEGTEDTGIVIKPEQWAYVIYTSGSTGRPKGCIISHGSLMNYVSWAARAYSAGGSERHWAVFSPLAFDLTVTSIFCPLVQGSKMYIFNDVRETNRILSFSFSDDNFINAIKLTPSHIDLLGKMDVKKTNIELIVCGGEALMKRHIDIIAKISPAINIVNEYGPTEATVGCAAKLIDPGEERVLIGRPVSNARIYILDDRLHLQPPGVEGEICIGGAGLAVGYINDPYLTNEKFVDNPYDPGKRLYRTGDRGRWKEDGQIEYRGRRDHQVKIRGYRIELEEVVHMAGSIDGVDAVAVRIVERQEEKYIVLYYQSKVNRSESAVRDQLAVKLPGYMVPQFIVKMDDFPITVNGKLDISAFPDVDGPVRENPDEHLSDVSPTESRLVAIWKTVLARDKINTTDNFFTLGGHSLNALKILLEIEEKFKVDLTLRDFFEKNNIRDLARYIDTRDSITIKNIAGISAGLNKIPLSHLQKSLWILSQDEDASAAYTICSGVSIKGEIDAGIMKTSLSMLIDRHEILRTQFLWEGEDLVQRIHQTAEMDFKLEYVDLRESGDIDEGLDKLVTQERGRPFRFEAFQSLFRVHLVRTGAERYVLMYIIHHIICDAESLKIVFRELLEIYAALKKESILPWSPVSQQFRDYAVWEKDLLSSSAFSSIREFWQGQYADVPAVLRLNTDYPIPVRQTFNGDVLDLEISAETTQAVRKLSADQQTSLFMFFIAAVNLLLYKYTGQNDIVIGIPVSTRLRKELEDQVGPYVNTLPVRARFKPEGTFISLLQELRETLIQSFGYQNYPFDMLITDLNILAQPGRNPLFDVMVSYQSVEGNRQAATAGLFDLEEFEPATVSSQFMLSMDFYETGETIRAVFNFNTAIFRKISIQLMRSRFAELLTQILRSPYEKIALFNPDKGIEEAKNTNEMQFDY